MPSVLFMRRWPRGIGRANVPGLPEFGVALLVRQRQQPRQGRSQPPAAD